MSSDTTVYTTYPDAAVDERGRYFDGEFLTSQDFVDEQRYHIDRLRRALDHLTVSGVTDGLDVAPAGAWKIKLSPGLAIDRVGRQLVVLAARDGVDVPKDIPGGAVDVGLYYAEVESRLHGGTSDEDGTRGATRFRELPALEFYAPGQTPPHPDGVPLARVRLGNDGAVTIDNPSPVRRASGLRLPSSSPDAPTLRAGFARPQLLALTGDLQITGKLGVGTPDPEAELDVRGLARLGMLSLREQAFKVAGDEATFYPVVFRDLDWTAGQCVLEIVRPNAQADAANAGSLMAWLRWHAADGHGSELLDLDVVQTRRFVANARLLGKDRLLVVWLRGNRSYAWRSRQRVELVDATAASKTLGNEKLDPRQNIEAPFDRDRYRLGPTLDREELRAGLTVNGDVHYTGQLSRLEVADNFTATIRAGDFYLGHSSRRGTPGRALVDLKDQLVLNYGGDWVQTTLHGLKTQIAGDAVLDKTLTVTGGVQGDLTLNTGNLKLTAGGLTIAKGATLGDQLTVTRASELIKLIRPRTTTGGATMFLELFQDDQSPASTPETYPFIRFHHGYRYWHRLEARSTGFHVLSGDPSQGAAYVPLFTGNIASDGTLGVNKAATLGDTLTVAKAATFSDTLTVSKATALQDTLTVAKNSTFSGMMRISRDVDHLTLHRAPTETTGGPRLCIELYQEDSNPPKVPEANMYIRFHHNYRYWHRLEARGTGLYLLEGVGDNLHDFYAGNLVSNSFHVVTGKYERLRMIRGIVDDGGTAVQGSGYSASRENSLTKITFNQAFDGPPTVVVTQQYPNAGNGSNSGSTLDNAVVCHVTKEAAWIKTGNGSGDQSWRKFHFIAVGP